MVFYPLFASENTVELYYRKHVIYATQTALIIVISLSSIMLYFFIRLVYMVLSSFFFIRTIIDFYRKKLSTPKDIIKRIQKMLEKYEYKQILKITKNHYKNNKEILYYHLLCLVKLKKRFTFVYTFRNYQSSMACELLQDLIKTWPNFVKSLFISWFCKDYQNNDIVAYIYAHHLHENNKHEKALKVLNIFLERKVFFSDHYTFYIFNKLALELERKISGNDDFAIQYIENIQNYEDDIQKKSRSF